MLRLKQALDECGIPQKSVVEATGFSKTQVSLTLSSGKLPADAERFMNGVYELISDSPRLCDWLKEHHSAASQLFEEIPSGPPLSKGGADRRGDLSADPETIIVCLAGKEAIEGLEQIEIIRLARAAHYLLIQARYYAGFKAAEITAATTDILQGEAS